MKNKRKLFFVSSTSLHGIPFFKFLIRAFKDHFLIHVTHISIYNFTNYFNEFSTTNVLTFKNQIVFNKQSTYQKLKKYVNATFFISRDYIRYRKESSLFYTIDLFSIGLLIGLKSLLKNEAFIVYHQVEMVENQKLSVLDSYLLKFIKMRIGKINLFVFPEKNRANYFETLIGSNLRDKIFILPNSNENVATPRLKVDQRDKTIFGHIGAVGLDHYIEKFLSIIEKLPSDKYEFYFIGTLGKEVLELIKQKNFSNVKIIGQIPHSKLSQYYNLIDVGVILYKDVSLNFKFCAPNKLYEYWSYGIPVIAHKLPGLIPLFNDQIQGNLVDFNLPITNLLPIFSDQTFGENREKLISLFNEKYHMRTYLYDLLEHLQN